MESLVMIFETLAEIGRGGFGRVDLIVDEGGNKFARKVFQPATYIPSSAHDRLRQRFRREVKIQANLLTPSIMPILHAELKGDAPAFVMPLAEKSYEEQIVADRASGSVDIDAVADILNGLEYLHELGYVHRDLNPKNILRVNDNWCLSDFGAVLPPTGQTLTLTEGTSIYTERYCAPEQRNDFHAAQASADVYSLGCILHDIFGTSPRTPYAKLSAPGPIGVIIEKCTEKNPDRRPTIKVLRNMLIEQLIEIGGHCKVDDAESGQWLKKLNEIELWDDDTYHAFARFFAGLDTSEMAEGHEDEWVYALSTPFLTRLSTDALAVIVNRADGIAEAIVEKYCEWAQHTAFEFAYADTVSSRLAVIFDGGSAAAKAMALIALIKLGVGHNRWYVMRQALRRCDNTVVDEKLGQRLRIEIVTEELEHHLRTCVDVVGWNVGDLSPEIRKLMD